jgi:hypothetical protein
MDKRTELLIKAQNELTAIKEELRKAKLDYKVLEERTYATEMDRDYWKEKWNMIQKGAVGLWCNDTRHILKAFPILNDFETTYPQEIDYNVINSALYQRYPYYVVSDKGDITICNEQYKKYIMEVV